MGEVSPLRAQRTFCWDWGEGEVEGGANGSGQISHEGRALALDSGHAGSPVFTTPGPEKDLGLPHCAARLPLDVDMGTPGLIRRGQASLGLERPWPCFYIQQS